MQNDRRGVRVGQIEEPSTYHSPFRRYSARGWLDFHEIWYTYACVMQFYMSDLNFDIISNFEESIFFTKTQKSKLTYSACFYGIFVQNKICKMNLTSYLIPVHVLDL